MRHLTQKRISFLFVSAFTKKRCTAQKKEPPSPSLLTSRASTDSMCGLSCIKVDTMDMCGSCLRQQKIGYARQNVWQKLSANTYYQYNHTVCTLTNTPEWHNLSHIQTIGNFSLAFFRQWRTACSLLVSDQSGFLLIACVIITLHSCFSQSHFNIEQLFPKSTAWAKPHLVIIWSRVVRKMPHFFLFNHFIIFADMKSTIYCTADESNCCMSCT